MCPSSTLHSSSHCSNDVSVDSVIGFSAGGSEANVTFERQRLHGKSGEGHDCRSRGTEASKEETDTTNDDRVQNRVQLWSGIQRDDQLGNSSAQRHFDTTITSVLPDNSSLAPLGREHPSEGKDESQTVKCSDDGRGLVKNLSGRLAWKLQRCASLVHAGLFFEKNQTVLEVAVVDRCGFVDICCSDASCLTEGMQQRGISSISLLRSDGVGNHDAQTREKLLGWFSEKRPQKAWFSPPVIAHQNNSTRCSLRAGQICRLFFGYAAAVLQFGGHMCWEWPAKCAGWSSVELREFRVQQKNCGRALFMAACDSCFFAKKNNLLEHHHWQFLTSDIRFKAHESSVSRKSRTRVETHIRRQESIQLQ